MATYNITYGTLKNKVTTYIKNSVKNVGQWNIPTSIKSGYSKTIKYQEVAWQPSLQSYGHRIDHNGTDLPTQYTENDLISDFSNFCTLPEIFSYLVFY